LLLFAFVFVSAFSRSPGEHHRLSSELTQPAVIHYTFDDSRQGAAYASSRL
jgi:hypothetical protein